jgi:aldose 1-epimerase
MTESPSGRQYRITSGAHGATVVEVGGGIREYTVGGRAVLAGYPEDQMCPGGKGTPLIPWPNRLAGGSYTFDGKSYQLPLTDPVKKTANHGLTRWLNWTPRERADDRVAMGLILHPQPAFPFTVDFVIDYRLAGDGLTVTTTATNIGGRRCPYASGHHPYLTAGVDLIDGCRLRLDAAERLLTDDRGIPVGAEPVEGTDYDFRAGRPIGDTVLDHAYTGLARDADGLAWAELVAPDGRVVRLWADRSYRYIQLYSGDTQAPELRRRALAVEPMTCAPNGFATGTDLLTLEPGQSISSHWGVRTA